MTGAVRRPREAIGVQIIPEELYDALTAADELLDRLIEATAKGDAQGRKYLYDRLTVIARKITEIRART